MDHETDEFYFGDGCSEDERREFREVWEKITEVQRETIRRLVVDRRRPARDLVLELPELIVPELLLRSVREDAGRIFWKGGRIAC